MTCPSETTTPSPARSLHLSLDTLNLHRTPSYPPTGVDGKWSHRKCMTPLPSPQVSKYEDPSASSGGRRTHDFFGTTSPASFSAPFSSHSHASPSSSTSPPTSYLASSRINDAMPLASSSLFTSPPRKPSLAQTSLGIGDSPGSRHVPTESISRLPSLVPDTSPRKASSSLFARKLSSAYSYSTSPTSISEASTDDDDDISPGTVLNDDYVIQRQLGNGAFSKVVLAQSKSALFKASTSSMQTVKSKRDRTLFAVKMIDRKTVERNDRMRISVLREVEVLKHIHHPSLVHLKESFTIPRYTCLVLEYAAGGELFELVTQHHSQFTEELVRRIFCELADVLGWMHSIGLVHRDVKLENILLTCDPLPLTAEGKVGLIDSPLIKLTDFGLSRFIDFSDPILNTRCGSEEYAAPELVMGLPYDGRQTDAWALGVVLYALLTGLLPFAPLDQIEHEKPQPVSPMLMRSTSSGASAQSRGRRARLMKIAKGAYDWPDASQAPLATPSAKQLVNMLLTRDASRRARVEQLFDSEWMMGPGSPARRKRTVSLAASDVPPELDDDQVWVRASAEEKEEQLLHAEVEPPSRDDV